MLDTLEAFNQIDNLKERKKFDESINKSDWLNSTRVTNLFGKHPTTRVVLIDFKRAVMCVVINFPLNGSKSCQETNSCAIILTNDNNVSKRRILDYIVHDVPLFCQEE